LTFTLSNFYENVKPEFSVIIPTYNRAYILGRAIESVLNQTESRFEIILVNDGSSDCTLRLLDEFCDDERIRVLTIQNQGRLPPEIEVWKLLKRDLSHISIRIPGIPIF